MPREKGAIHAYFTSGSDENLTVAAEQYAHQMEALGNRMLPVYARALDMPDEFFKALFEKPLYRPRMRHYLAV